MYPLYYKFTYKLAIISDEKFRLSCPISINGQIDEDVKAGEFHIGKQSYVK